MDTYVWLVTADFLNESSFVSFYAKKLKGSRVPKLCEDDLEVTDLRGTLGPD